MPTRHTVLAPLLFASTVACAADLSPACQPLLAAMEKSILADHNTTTVRAGKTSHGVTVGGVNYLEIRGAWRKSSSTPQDSIAQSRENLKNARSFTCSPLPDSAVNGVAVSNYATRTVTEDDTVEGKVSIAKATGRVVQVDNDIKTVKDAHYVTQYSYDNVKAPL